MTRSQSLQHSEALARFDLLDVTSYDVSLDLASDEATFGSVTTLTFESLGGPTFVDLKPTTLRRISLNDRPLDVDRLDRGRFPLDTVAGTNVLVVDAVMPFRNDGEGLHRHVDPADGRHYVYGMCFMDAAPTIFACFDQPDLKAPYTFHVRAPRDWTVTGNAPASNPEPGAWEIGPTAPLSTYFVTLVAGPYRILRSEHDGIPLSIASKESLAETLERDAAEILEVTGQCFDEFHRLFGIRYPFGDYHQAFVPEFNAGAMENPGCVTFRDQFLFETRATRDRHIQRATTIAHEMAHQWFGNITTPKWWDDLWLNESFAEYAGNRVAATATRFDDAWTHVSWARRMWGVLDDSGPSTHPVAGNGATDAVAALQDFDGISYSKGSSILRQLATSLGDEIFLAGASDHFRTHYFGNATMHDLLASWERAGAGDLSPVVSQWLRTAGPDTFTVDRARGVLVRTPPAGRPADRRHALSVGRWTASSYDETAVLVTGPETPLPGDLTGPLVIDPHEQSWGLYVPDAETVRGLAAVLPRQRDPMRQAAVWNNVRSGYAVAAIDPDDVVDLLVAAFPAEDATDGPRRTVVWMLSQVLPAATTGAAARVLDAVRGRLAAAEAGSELQLSALRTAIHLETDAETLRAWRAGRGLPPGIEPDADLAWRLLVRLATLGAVDQAALDAALSDEPTAFAQVEHSRASASLPTAAAKAAAWAKLTGQTDVPNYELEAAGLGFWRVGQEAVTAPYVERYVADLPATASVRSGWVLALTAESFFPRTAVDERTLELVGSLLEPGVLEPAVRRRVVDQVEVLRCSLAVRRAFPKA